MPLTQTAVPNIPETNQLLNDTYTDRNSTTHTGIVAEDNRLRDIMASIQANVTAIVSSMEGTLSSHSGSINGLISTVSTLNGKVSDNTADITTNANAILALSQRLDEDIVNVKSLISQNSTDITTNSDAISTINSSLNTLQSLVQEMNSAFSDAMASDNLRVSAEYQYLDELPSFAGAAEQGSFAIVGHTTPQLGDLIYQAGSTDWIQVSDWNLVSVAASLALVPTPTSITDIVAIGTDGSYTLYQPVVSYADDGVTPVYSYSETTPLGTPAAIIADSSGLPKITLSDGSMVVFQYHYRTLVDDASEGEYALVDGTSYKYTATGWEQESPSHKFFVIAWNGAWVPVSTGSGAGGSKAITFTKLTANSAPTFDGNIAGDSAYYIASGASLVSSLWQWTGTQWLRIINDSTIVRTGTTPALAGATFTNRPTVGNFTVATYQRYSTLSALGLVSGQYVGQRVDVYADTTPENNGEYIWDGSSWNIASRTGKVVGLVTDNIGVNIGGTYTGNAISVKLVNRKYITVDVWANYIRMDSSTGAGWVKILLDNQEVSSAQRRIYNNRGASVTNSPFWRMTIPCSPGTHTVALRVTVDPTSAAAIYMQETNMQVVDV